VRGVLGVLADHPEGLAATDVLKAVEQRVPPTSHEQADYPSHPGIRRFEKTVRFATIGPVKAGWLVKDKGQWSITEDGRTAYSSFADPEALQREWGRLYKAWKKSRPEPTAGEQEAEEESDETATATLEEAEEAAWREIREYLGQMPPYDFQNLVAALLRAMGYHVLWVAPPGPDRGIDMIAYTDPLGTSRPRIKVQVKRQAASKIDAHGLRAFIGTLGAEDVGIYVSAGGFTSEAERESRSEMRHVTLINLNRLVELWVEYSPKLGDADRQLLPLKPIYFLTPSE
jgi:restriction system protein